MRDTFADRLNAGALADFLANEPEADKSVAVAALLLIGGCAELPSIPLAKVTVLTISN